MEHGFAHLVGHAFDVNPFNESIGLANGLENFIGSVFENFCDIDHFETKAKVWAVAAVFVHGFLVSNVREGAFKFNIANFECFGDERFDEIIYESFIDEGGFHIELSEFGLSVWS